MMGLPLAVRSPEITQLLLPNDVFIGSSKYSAISLLMAKSSLAEFSAIVPLTSLREKAGIRLEER